MPRSIAITFLDALGLIAGIRRTVVRNLWLVRLSWGPTTMRDPATPGLARRAGGYHPRRHATPIALCTVIATRPSAGRRPDALASNDPGGVAVVGAVSTTHRLPGARSLAVGQVAGRLTRGCRRLLIAAPHRSPVVPLCRLSVPPSHRGPMTRRRPIHPVRVRARVRRRWPVLGHTSRAGRERVAAADPHVRACPIGTHREADQRTRRPSAAKLRGKELTDDEGHRRSLPRAPSVDGAVPAARGLKRPLPRHPRQRKYRCASECEESRDPQRGREPERDGRDRRKIDEPRHVVPPFSQAIPTRPKRQPSVFEGALEGRRRRVGAVRSGVGSVPHLTLRDLDLDRLQRSPAAPPPEAVCRRTRGVGRR